MKTIKYYQICVEIFGGALKEINISFSKPEDAKKFIEDEDKKGYHYCYKEVSKNIFTSLDDYKNHCQNSTNIIER